MNRSRMLSTLLIVGLVAACGAETKSLDPASQAAGIQGTPSPGASANASSSSEPSAVPTATAPATPVASPTPTAIPTPVPTPVPWKTYKSKRNHYSMTYPPTWVVTPGSARLADEFDAFGYPYVYLSRDTVSTSVSISLTVSHEIAANKSHYKAKLKSNKAIKLRGYAGRILVFEGVDHGLKVRIERIIVAKGKVGYFFSLYADLTTAARDSATFKKMYQSWRPT